MIHAPDALARWQACQAVQTLPWPWWLRKFLTITFPQPAARLKHSKARWHGH